MRGSRIAAVLGSVALASCLAWGADSTASLADSQERGKALFERHCTACHGDLARGDGPAAALLQPAPADLTRPDYSHGTSEDQVSQVIANGVPMTAMAGWSGTFTAEQIQDLVHYLGSLRRRP